MRTTNNKLRQALTNWICFIERMSSRGHIAGRYKPDDLSPRQALELLYNLRGWCDYLVPLWATNLKAGHARGLTVRPEPFGFAQESLVEGWTVKPFVVSLLGT